MILNFTMGLSSEQKKAMNDYSASRGELLAGVYNAGVRYFSLPMARGVWTGLDLTEDDRYELSGHLLGACNNL